MTIADHNKQLLQHVFAELAKGNGKPFTDSLADDVCWVIHGTTAWSGRYEGRQAVLNRLLKPLFAQFATTYTNTAQSFIAQDDRVVVECSGQVTTRTGKAYNNRYCYVCRLADGKVLELVEYMDTDLLNTALEAPVRVDA